MDLDIVLEKNYKQMVIVGRKIESDKKEQKEVNMFKVQKVSSNIDFRKYLRKGHLMNLRKITYLIMKLGG